MSEFTGETVKDYTQASPLLIFKATDEDLYKQYKDECLATSQKYFRMLVARNGE